MDELMETLELIEQMDEVLASLDENIEGTVQSILEEEDKDVNAK